MKRDQASEALLDLNQIKKGVALSPYITGFLLAHDLHWAEATHKTYEQALKQFEAYRKDRSLPALNALLVKQYVRHLNLYRRSPAYVQRQLSVLRTFSAWAVEEHILPEDPTKKVPLPKLSQEYRKEALDPEEKEKLVAQISIRTPAKLRDYLLVSLILQTAVRLVELHRMNVEDFVQKGEGGLLYVHGKGREAADSFVVIVPALIPAMERYKRLRGLVSHKAPLFVAEKPVKGARLSVRGIQYIITKYLKQAGIKRNRLTAYSLRHTAATEALTNGADFKAVQDMMRHKSMNTTMKYDHMVRRIADGAESFIKVAGGTGPDLSEVE